MTSCVLVLGDRDTRYLTHREVDSALALFPDDLRGGWTATDNVTEAEVASAAGVWLVPGGPYRDDDAVLATISSCIDSDTPFLGTCSGFQYACLALASRAGFSALHAEADPTA